MIDVARHARVIAHRAHAGQLDKAGRPYIEHLARVARAVRGDAAAEAVAWLHDLIEDQPEHARNLEAFPAEIRTAIHLLTRVAGVSPESYYAGIRKNRLALLVKLTDIDDNANEARLAALAPEEGARLRAKYAKARESLWGRS